MLHRCGLARSPVAARWPGSAAAVSVLALPLCLAACSLIVDPPRGETTRCTEDRHCLGGSVCSGATCVPAGGADGGGRDAGSGSRPSDLGGSAADVRDVGGDPPGPDLAAERDSGPQPEPPQVTLRSEVLPDALLISGAAFTDDLSEVVTFHRSSKLAFSARDGEPHDSPTRELLGASERHLIRRFVVSPHHPLVVLAVGQGTLEVHRILPGAAPEHLGDVPTEVDGTFRGQPHFDATGLRVASLSNDTLVVYELLPQIRELFREPTAGLPNLPHPEFVFFGADSHIAVVESLDDARLRLVPATGDGTWGAATSLSVDQPAGICERMSCLAGSGQTTALIAGCVDGTVVLVLEPLGRSETTMLGRLPAAPDSVALSPDGALAAAVADEDLYVWQTATPAAVATVHVGPAEDSVKPFLSFARDGVLLSLDRDSRMLVYRVEAAGP